MENVKKNCHGNRIKYGIKNLLSRVKNWIACNNCVMVCPFNKPKGMLHDLVRFSIKNIPIINRLLLLLDDAMEYGKFIKLEEKNFWEK